MCYISGIVFFSIQKSLWHRARIATLQSGASHLNVFPVISLELRPLFRHPPSSPPCFPNSLKLAFLHKLSKFKFPPHKIHPTCISFLVLSACFYPARKYPIGRVMLKCDLIFSWGGTKWSRGGTLAPWGGWSDSVFNHAATPPTNFLLTRGWALIASIATHMIVAFIITVIGDQKRIYAISEQSGL